MLDRPFYAFIIIVAAVYCVLIGAVIGVHIRPSLVPFIVHIETPTDVYDLTPDSLTGCTKIEHFNIESKMQITQTGCNFVHVTHPLSGDNFMEVYVTPIYKDQDQYGSYTPDALNL